MFRDHLLDARIHLVFFDELATLHLRDRAVQFRKEIGIFVENVQSSVADHVNYIASLFPRNLYQPQLLLACEVDLHNQSIGSLQTLRQRSFRYAPKTQ